MTVHLHCHSEYSLNQGMLRFAGAHEIGALAAQRGIEAVALTDSNNIHAAIRHRASCVRHGIKPILGCHATFARGEQAFAATLLCADAAGFRSLSRLLTVAQLRNKGRIDATAITAEDAKGLFMLTGYAGDVSAALCAGREEDAHKLLEGWANVFPAEQLACELSFGGRIDEQELVPHLASLAQKMGIPAVAAQPILFANEEDFQHHEVRCCIANSWQHDSTSRPRPHSTQQYFWSADAMHKQFAQWPGALANAAEIARRCNYEFGLAERPHFPRFFADDGKVVEDPPALLRVKATAGLAQLVAPEAPEHEKYAQRLGTELEVICSKGFADYFLIVADFVSFAKEADIPVGPGRGSGAGSLVAYSLGITGVDPLKYDLLFERFLNPERTALPDFDIDFCKDRRGEIFSHARKIYGADCVSQVITFGTLKAKAVVRDVCRALGLPYATGDQLARLIPDELNITLTEARAKTDELDKFLKNENRMKDVWEHCLALEGLPRQASTHAAAILIAPQPMTEYCPLTLVGGRNKEEPVCQYDKDDAEAVGLIKFDFLGLKNLTMLHKAEQLLHQHGHPRFHFKDIKLDDKDSFRLYQTGNTIGLFQCESQGMVALMRQVDPHSIDDIAITISMYRPGVLSSNLHRIYLDNHANPHKVTYPHERARVVLEPTNGVMIYQEQVMRLSQVLAGFSLAKADQLRAAIGKKNSAAMASLGDEFISASSEYLGAKAATKLFGEIQEFAGYGFNKSHAIAYALVSYQTAYCKAKYPAVFYAAALSTWADDSKTIAQLLEDAHHNKITIKLPSINKSQTDFTVINDTTIQFGLGSIRGAGQRLADCLVEERDRNGPFTSLEQLCERLPREMLPRRLLAGIIHAGACDCLLPGIEARKSRPQLKNSIAGAIDHGIFVQQHANQDSLFGDETASSSGSTTMTVTGNNQPIPSYSSIEQLTHEETFLGAPLSDSYYHVWQWLLPRNLTPLRKGETSDEQQWWAGHVSRHIVNPRIRAQNRSVFRLTDGTANVEVNAKGDAAQDIDFSQPGLVVIVQGAFEESFGGMRILQARKIYDINRWCERTGGRVQFDSAYIDELGQLLENLRKLRAERNPGKHKLEILLHTQQGDGKSELSPGLQLRADDLLTLRERLSNQAMKFFPS